jgi:hypothetical protein
MIHTLSQACQGSHKERREDHLDLGIGYLFYAVNKS